MSTFQAMVNHEIVHQIATPLEKSEDISCDSQIWFACTNSCHLLVAVVNRWCDHMMRRKNWYTSPLVKSC